MPPAQDYELPAQRVASNLAAEIRKGFKSVRREALADALRQAAGRPGGKSVNLAKSALEALQKALDREHIETYPSLEGKESHPAYRLYHKDNEDVKFLIDVITNLSEITDEMLGDFLSRKEVIEVITVVRTVKGVS